VESAWGHETAPVAEWGHNGDLSSPSVVAAPLRPVSQAEHIDEVPRLTRNQRSVMDWLAEGRDVSLRDLGDRLQRAPVTVKSLFHRGLVGYGQRWDEADSGSDLDRTVRLTPRGRTVMDLLQTRDDESV
jgi:DNA-binding CsgD family transcriptional regulator